MENAREIYAGKHVVVTGDEEAVTERPAVFVFPVLCFSTERKTALRNHIKTVSKMPENTGTDSVPLPQTALRKRSGRTERSSEKPFGRSAAPALETETEFPIESAARLSVQNCSKR